jgi:hypothetical protein
MATLDARGEDPVVGYPPGTPFSREGPSYRGRRRDPCVSPGRSHKARAHNPTLAVTQPHTQGCVCALADPRAQRAPWYAGAVTWPVTPCVRLCGLLWPCDALCWLMARDPRRGHALLCALSCGLL